MRGFIAEVERQREYNIKLERELHNIQEEHNEVYFPWFSLSKIKIDNY